MTQTEELHIKEADQRGAIVGSHHGGGLVEHNGKMMWIRHNRWRFNQTNGSWGHENGGFTDKDVTGVGYRLELTDPRLSQLQAESSLRMLKEGETPAWATVGAETEAYLCDAQGHLVDKHDGVTVRIETDQHPELHAATCETATGQLADGRFPQTGVEIARALSGAIIDGYEIAARRGAYIQYSSAFETGSPEEARITQHPYLAIMEPRVFEHMIANWEAIPRRVLELYANTVGDPKRYFAARQHLNWPVQAFHVHTGMPEIDGLVDTRTALVAAHIRNTPFAKLASMMLYNTERLFEIQQSTLDIRSLLRRVLATTHDTSLPESAQELVSGVLREMETGLIHSPSRFPESGQHGTVRLRMEAGYKTLESIDASMCPDLRLDLAWVFMMNIMNVIALEAMEIAQGNETEALRILRSRSILFREMTAMNGNMSSFSWDTVFNVYGWHGRIPGSESLFAHGLRSAQDEVMRIGKTYRTLAVQCRCVSEIMDQQLGHHRSPNLSTYLGTEKGTFAVNGKNSGPLTDSKIDLPTAELIREQHEGTRLQAQALQQVRDDADLLAFFGVRN